MLLPPLVAVLVAASRTIDYHHNFSDIVAGSLLGCAIAGLAALNRIGDIEAARDSVSLQESHPVSLLPQHYDAVEELSPL
jgi:membrane-associated phospholipid phosphatase